MSASLTYPGVYIEELPSGVHSITGVATSIGAFVGWAPQGSITAATMVESFAEYSMLFGGLDSRSVLGYAVNHFFINGGRQCYVIRLVDATDATTATGSADTLTLFANNPGNWGNNLRITLTPNGTRFSILVEMLLPSGNFQTLESFVNLSTTSTDPQYCVTVIDNDSNYISFIDQAGTLHAPSASPTITVTRAALTTGFDGTVLVPNDGNFETALLPPSNVGGVNLLNSVDIFNLLCVPGENTASAVTGLQTYCFNSRAFLIVDAPQVASHANLQSFDAPAGMPFPTTVIGADAASSAYYFPWVLAPDPLFGNRPALFPPCGFIAGMYAATDASRGVWKAPAGIDASLSGEQGLQYSLNDAQNGDLNPVAINCLRHFKAYGDVIWGARTLAGNDQTGSQWKYVPIRRLALYLESSLYDGMQWVVFEPNDERLWGQIRMNAGAFMQGLFLQGAFAGTTPQQAYFVKCDAENNPPASVALGVVNTLVGFAPEYPAEFVVIQIQQISGQGS
ncbi:MAG: phage tail sheath C-terminal domain-containing protein [Candidatus Tumulicola sp.]